MPLDQYVSQNKKQPFSPQKKTNKQEVVLCFTKIKPFER